MFRLFCFECWCVSSSLETGELLCSYNCKLELSPLL